MMMMIRRFLLLLSFLLTTPPGCTAMDYRYFVAGGTCAAISHGITTPIDVVKTKIQANPDKFQNQGLHQAAVTIVREEGPGALLAGLAPTLVGYGVEGAMKFGVYELCKPLLAQLLQGRAGLSFLLSSAVAGGVAALLLCPMESTRIRMVTDPAYEQDGLLGAVWKLIQTDGTAALFATGLAAMLAKQVPYTFGKQVSFDVVAGWLYGAAPAAIRDNQWMVSFLAAGVAALVACIMSQPGDMILTETYRPAAATQAPKRRLFRRRGAPPAPVDRSFGAVCQTIQGRGGVPAFFTGTGARIVHVGMIITSQLVIYDVVKQMLGLPATGSH